MYTLTYIYTSLYQIKESMLLSNFLLLFPLKKHINLDLREFEFDCELNILRKPYLLYVSSTCMQNFINIDQRRLWEISTFI